MNYTINYQDKKKRIFRIEGPGMPAYFAMGCREVGRELAFVNEDHLTFGIDLVDKHLIKSFMHSNRVVNGLKKKGNLDELLVEK